MKKIKVWCEACCGCGISNIRTKWADDCWWEYSYCVKCGGKGYIIKLVCKEMCDAISVKRCVGNVGIE